MVHLNLYRPMDSRRLSSTRYKQWINGANTIELESDPLLVRASQQASDVADKLPPI